MRLFLALWPDSGARAALAAFERPEVEAVRWSDPAALHVTLRFLGNVVGDGREVIRALGRGPLLRAREDGGSGRSGEVGEFGGSGEVGEFGEFGGSGRSGEVGEFGGSREIVLGPETHLLGDRNLVMPASGAEPLARHCDLLLGAAGFPPRDGVFRGHMTLARAGARAGPGALGPLAGRPFRASFPATAVCLVASEVSDAGSRYENVATFPLR